MKATIFAIAALIVLSFAVVSVDAGNSKSEGVVEANVWVDADGQKHFTCPVMGEKGVVDEKIPYSVVDGKKYYHCCAGCSEKFQAETNKYLKDFSVPANVIKVDEDGKHFRCVVSGEMGTVSEKTAYSDVDGKRYYFCCDNCKKKFDADSEKFMKSMKKSSKEMKHEHKHDQEHDHK